MVIRFFFNKTIEIIAKAGKSMVDHICAFDGLVGMEDLTSMAISLNLKL